MAPTTSSPITTFHSNILSIYSTIIAMLLSLSRPTSLISTINTSRKAIERSYNSLSRSTRWPLGLLDETRQRLNEEKEDKVRKATEDTEELGKELRYTQQVVASELAGWQDLHEKMGRRAIRDLAKGMLIREKTTLEGMRRAIRRLKKGELAPVSRPPVPVEAKSDVEFDVDGASGVVELSGGSSSSDVEETPRMDCSGSENHETILVG